MKIVFYAVYVAAIACVWGYPDWAPLRLLAFALVTIVAYVHLMTAVEALKQDLHHDDGRQDRTRVCRRKQKELRP